jgi:hypothetical protein
LMMGLSATKDLARHGLNGAEFRMLY